MACAQITIAFGRHICSALFASVQSLFLTELRGFGAPSLITRTTHEVQQVQATLVMLLTTMLTAPIMGGGAVIMAVLNDSDLSLVLFVSVSLLAIIVGVLVMRTLPLFSSVQDLIDRISQILREQINGLRVATASSIGRYFLSRAGHGLR